MSKDIDDFRLGDELYVAWNSNGLAKQLPDRWVIRNMFLVSKDFCDGNWTLYISPFRSSETFTCSLDEAFHSFEDARDYIEHQEKLAKIQGVS